MYNVSSLDLGNGQRPTAIALRHFVGHPNIGDAVNPALIRTAFGLASHFEPRIDRPHLLALGSVIDWATRSSHVWGSGMIDPERGWGGLQSDQVWAVRGKASWSALRAGGVSLRDVPLGDPGVLIPRLLEGERTHPDPSGPIGLIPHYGDWNHPAILHLGRQDDIRLIDVRLPPSRFFAQLHGCSAVLSSSLHGLVFSEALGFPNLWVTLGHDLVGGGFKFHDWFSTCAEPQARQVELPFQPIVRELKEQCRLHSLHVDADALAQAVPEGVVEQLSERARLMKARVVPAGGASPPPVVVFILSNSPFATRQMLTLLSRQSLKCQPVLLLAPGASREQRNLLEMPDKEPVPVIALRSSPSGAESIEQAVAAFFEFWETMPFFVIANDLDFVKIEGRDVLCSMKYYLEDHFEVASVGLVANGANLHLTRALLRTQSRSGWAETGYEHPEGSAIESPVMRRPASGLHQLRPHILIAPRAGEDYLPLRGYDTLPGLRAV